MSALSPGNLHRNFKIVDGKLELRRGSLGRIYATVSAKGEKRKVSLDGVVAYEKCAMRTMKRPDPRLKHYPFEGKARVLGAGDTIDWNFINARVKQLTDEELDIYQSQLRYDFDVVDCADTLIFTLNLLPTLP